jgi:hypothetical protein
MRSYRADSRASERTSAEDRKQEATRRCIAREVERAGARDLDVLVTAGMDRHALLEILSLAATYDDTSAFQIRRSQAQIKSLAGRMETLAHDAKRVLDNPSSKVQFCAYTYGGGSAIGMKWPDLWGDIVGVSLIPISMKWLAGLLRDKSRRGKGLSMDHLGALARLLTDAFDAAGKKKEFSADGLNQIFKRRVKRMFRLFLKFCESVPPPQPPSMPPASCLEGTVWKAPGRFVGPIARPGQIDPLKFPRTVRSRS